MRFAFDFLKIFEDEILERFIKEKKGDNENFV